MIERLQSLAPSSVMLSPAEWSELAYALYPLQADLCLVLNQDQQAISAALKSSWRRHELIQAGSELRRNHERLRTSTPGDWLQAHNLLLRALELQAQPDAGQARALAALDQALTLDPGLALAYVLRAKLREVYRFNPSGASLDMAKALELQPDRPDWHARHAWLLWLSDQHEAGKAAIAEAIRLNPEDGRNYYLRSLFYDFSFYDADESKDNAAEQAYQQDLELAQQYAYQDADLFVKLGWHLKGRKQTRAADQAFERARKILLETALADPDDPRFGNLHPQVMAALEDPAGRRSDLEQLVRHSPDQPGAYLLRGLAYQAQGDPAAAGRDFERALALEPRHAASLEALAKLELIDNSPAKALARFESLLELDPHNTDYLDGLAEAHQRLGHDELARNLTRRSALLRQREFILYPEHDTGLTEHQDWFETHGEEALWREGLTEMVARWPQHPLPYLYLATALEYQDRSVEALDLLRQGLSQIPGHPTLLDSYRSLLLPEQAYASAQAAYADLQAEHLDEAFYYARRAVLNTEADQYEQAESDREQAIRLYQAALPQVRKSSQALSLLHRLFEELE